MSKIKGLSGPKNALTHIPNSIITRDMQKVTAPSGNVYESLNIIARRANQVGTAMKSELNDKLSEFSNSIDNLEEVHENREQIEISKLYEKLPKPTEIAIHEFLDGKVGWQYPDTEAKISTQPE